MWLQLNLFTALLLTFHICTKDVRVSHPFILVSQIFGTSGWDMQSVMITTMHLFFCCEQNHYLLPDGEENKKASLRQKKKKKIILEDWLLSGFTSTITSEIIQRMQSTKIWRSKHWQTSEIPWPYSRLLHCAASDAAAFFFLNIYNS